MAENFVDVPRGGDAFASEGPMAERIRVAQLLGMGTQAFGSPGQVAALRSEADEIGTPNLATARTGPSVAYAGLPPDQRALDRLTEETAASARTELRAFPHPGHARVDGARLALWQHVERSRSPAALVALANHLARTAGGLDRVAAAAVLAAVPNRRYSDAQVVLASARQGERQAAELAAASSGGDGSDRDTPGSPARAVRILSPVSVAIHGTWGRLGADRWYAPEGAVHQRIRRECTPSLFSGDDYFRWAGGYGDAARQQGTADFLRWLADRGVVELDTVFAHSHGGNVALSAAAAGIRVKLLVLMHVPALDRPVSEWRTIVANVDHVVVMRTRLDYVVLADGLRTGSAQAFSQSLLPHREILPYVLDERGWISHETFIRDPNWAEWNLAREIRYERATVSVG
jgi:hypothetical protein